MPDPMNSYSEEAHAILGRMPSWIVRWGVTVLFAIFAGIILGCCFIKHPDTVEAPIVVTTLNPPADLIARYDGLIDSICVTDGQAVSRGTTVAVLRNAADRYDVGTVADSLTAAAQKSSRELAASPWLFETYRLGELQAVFADLQAVCRDYRHYLATDWIGRKRQLLRQQIDKNREYFDRLRHQHALLAKDLAYQRALYNRDSILFEENVISAADFETSAQNLLHKQNSKAGFEATLTTTELTIIRDEQQLIELTLQQENETAEFERDIARSRQQFLAQVAQWKQQYVLEAPAAGRVALVNFWSENQHVRVGDKLASIVPDAPTEVIGRMQIPTAGFGKVKIGQAVRVKLSGYPYMEFGVLRGSVRSLSAVPEQMQTGNGATVVYIAEVVFPEGLRTSYNRDLPMIQQMDGTAEIITEEMRLISRFIRPVVSLFKNR